MPSKEFPPALGTVFWIIVRYQKNPSSYDDNNILSSSTKIVVPNARFGACKRLSRLELSPTFLLVDRKIILMRPIGTGVDLAELAASLIG